MGTTPLPHSISSFRDALGIAFQLADHHPSRTYAFATDKTGAIQTVLHTDLSVATIAVELSRMRPLATPGSGCLVTSGFDQPLAPPSRADVVTFSVLSATAQSLGRNFLDWIAVDGDDARSYGYLFKPEHVWLCDPPAIRSEDQAAMLAHQQPR